MSTTVKWLVVGLTLSTLVASRNQIAAQIRANLTVNFSDASTGKLFHFWESTGLCPPEPYRNATESLLDRDMAFNLRFIGALPRQGLMQVRIHWMLNLITIDGISNDSSLSYNFSSLDELVHRLWENDLKPGFELMGNPSNFFNDFENRSQLLHWKQLITTTAKRYIGKYGLKYVRQWNFESWNEPDHKDFDGFNITVQGFLNYYDACSEGLLAAHPSLRLGGPAESFRPNFITYSWQLLEHCTNGTNYFTGKRGVRIDFISMHQKGNQTAESILDAELAVIDEIQKRLPNLSQVLVYNDEGDPKTGWWRSEQWRADTNYAAIIAKVIVDHQNRMSSINVRPGYLLSNDNGFLNAPPLYFEQRTLLTRFTWNHSHPRIVQMIRKPAYILTGLLNYLPKEQVRLGLTVEGYNASESRFLSGLAAYHIQNQNNFRDSWQAALLVINSADMTSSNSDEAELFIRLRRDVRNGSHHNYKNIFQSRYVCYKMDNNLTNPYQVWQTLGEPNFPNLTQLEAMRSQEGPYRVFRPKPWRMYSNSKTQSLTIRSTLNQPGILLCHVCDQPKMAPGPVCYLPTPN